MGELSPVAHHAALCDASPEVSPGKHYIDGGVDGVEKHDDGDYGDETGHTSTGTASYREGGTAKVACACDKRAQPPNRRGLPISVVVGKSDLELQSPRPSPNLKVVSIGEQKSRESGLIARGLSPQGLSPGVSPHSLPHAVHPYTDCPPRRRSLQNSTAHPTSAE